MYNRAPLTWTCDDALHRYNIDNLGSEGGLPGIDPTFGSGQDGFLASLDTKGGYLRIYQLPRPFSITAWRRCNGRDLFQAVSFCQQSTRAGGIDAALNNNGSQLSALLVPPDVAQTYQIAAQAGNKPLIHSDFLLLFSYSQRNRNVAQVADKIADNQPRISNDHAPRWRQCRYRHAIRSRAHDHSLVRSYPDQICIGNRRSTIHFRNEAAADVTQVV